MSESKFLATKRLGGFSGHFSAHGRVYALSSKLVVKILKLGFLYEIIRESEISKELYDFGISVPKPEGIFRVKIIDFISLQGHFFPIKKEGFVMQRINGVKGDKTFGDLRRKIEVLYYSELIKCEKEGFFPGDSGLHNSIYSPQNQKLYLIDFCNWEKASKNN